MRTGSKSWISFPLRQGLFRYDTLVSLCWQREWQCKITAPLISESSNETAHGLQDNSRLQVVCSSLVRWFTVWQIFGCPHFDFRNNASRRLISYAAPSSGQDLISHRIKLRSHGKMCASHEKKEAWVWGHWMKWTWSAVSNWYGEYCQLRNHFRFFGFIGIW